MARITNRDLERQLGFFESPTKKRCAHEGPLRDLQVEIERIVDEYSTLPSNIVALSVPLRQDLDRAYADLGPRLWSDSNGRFDYLANARDNDLEGFYTRNLFYSVPEDRTLLEELFHKWIKQKVVRRVSNVRNGMVKPRGPLPDWTPHARGKSSSTSIRSRLESSEVSDFSSCTSQQSDVEESTGPSESDSEDIEIKLPQRSRGLRSSRASSAFLQRLDGRSASRRKRQSSAADQAPQTKRTRAEHAVSGIKSTSSTLMVTLFIPPAKLAFVSQQYTPLEKVNINSPNKLSSLRQTAASTHKRNETPISANATSTDHGDQPKCGSTQSTIPTTELSDDFEGVIPVPLSCGSQQCERDQQGPSNDALTKPLQSGSGHDTTPTRHLYRSETPKPAPKLSDLDARVSELFTAVSGPLKTSSYASSVRPTTSAGLDSALLASATLQAMGPSPSTNGTAADYTESISVIQHPAAIPAHQSTPKELEQNNLMSNALEDGSSGNASGQASANIFENAEILIDWGMDVGPPTYFAMEDCALVEDLFCLVERYMPTPLRSMRIKELAFETITKIEGPKVDCRIIRDNQLGRPSLRRMKKVLARQCKEQNDLEMKIHVEWECRK
ncbi:uncharacterized protein MYCFIDRAFT_83916 [Pseudocercospora fijiensis CIRAD86]|uniref:Uncharacterized protein n=1 Tax=Pseudocercospora fijiensis (strain CIRAD86) TaxID=383855 RepID=N1Q763_PSEFD|nr:uncharacterized protein MYCFIDRAFT_83916 [Pseudocercospora fijiensis CIRAD86]EME88454.1 hypothetical protein MYCFIDRAFT_83916 [Pseudocercospora fijiensis CIRAD86]